MLASPLQLDFGLTGPVLTAGLPPISAVWHNDNVVLVQGFSENEGLQTRRWHQAAKEWCGTSQASSGEEGSTPDGSQNFSWQQFLSDPPQWWDKKPAWVDQSVDSELLVGDGGRRRPPVSVASVEGAPGRLSAPESALETVLCRKLCEYGQLTEAVDALSLRVHQGCHVPNNLFYLVLKRCLAQKDLVLGRRIHALTIKSGYEGDDFLATHLIRLYASLGRLKEAMKAFSKVSTPDAYNWAAIILAYARHGEPTQAIGLYRQMRESSVKPSKPTFLAVLKACASARDLAAGKSVHSHIMAGAGEPDMVVQTCLVDMYAKCGSLEDARRVFDRLGRKDLVTWTVMIAGYAKQGMGHEALNLYSSMQQEGISPPNTITFVCLLQACARVGVAALLQGKQLHAQIEESGIQDDVVLGGSLVNMYAKCGRLEDARKVFDKLPQKNVVTWTGMIAGYAQQGMGQEALSLYKGMQQEGATPPDCVTFVCLLQACASVGAVALCQGKELHAQIEEQGMQHDVAVGGSLVNMYAKCGSVEDAHKVFFKLSQKNVVTWTVMIAAYAQKGRANEAISVYTAMQQESSIAPPGPVTFVCLLQACATAAALPLGKQLHSQIEEQGLQADVVVGCALVNMYAKCGCLEEAQQVFDSLLGRDIVAWSALIAGYTRQGDSDAVFGLLDRMRQEGIHPNSVTFMSVLTVCSHAGLVDKGRTYFHAMSTDYGISPALEHYTCMVDLLGRSGQLNEALDMVKTMPFQPDGAVWLTLLGACRKWGNVEVGRQAFDSALGLDAADSSAYVLMANIYAAADMWEEAQQMQARRVKFVACKELGQSWWTDTSGEQHAFMVGDKTYANHQDTHQEDTEVHVHEHT